MKLKILIISVVGLISTQATSFACNMDVCAFESLNEIARVERILDAENAAKLAGVSSRIEDQQASKGFIASVLESFGVKAVSNSGAVNTK